MEGKSRPGVLRAWLAWWLLCAALWLALIDRTALDELLTGVVAAAIGATAAVLVRQQRRTLTRPRPRWVAAAHRPVRALAGDLPALARVLVVRGVLRREETGAVREMAFGATGDDPRSLAYRVWTASLGSLAPNTIVLDIDADSGRLYAHQLVPRDHPADEAMPLGEP